MRAETVHIKALLYWDGNGFFHGRYPSAKKPCCIMFYEQKIQRHCDTDIGKDTLVCQDVLFAIVTSGTESSERDP